MYLINLQNKTTKGVQNGKQNYGFAKWCRIRGNKRK